MCRRAVDVILIFDDSLAVVVVVARRVVQRRRRRRRLVPLSLEQLDDVSDGQHAVGGDDEFRLRVPLVIPEM